MSAAFAAFVIIIVIVFIFIICLFFIFFLVPFVTNSTIVCSLRIVPNGIRFTGISNSFTIIRIKMLQISLKYSIMLLII